MIGCAFASAGWRRSAAGARPPAHLKDPARVAELTKESVAGYTRNELAMARLAKENGARFILAVNPTLDSSDYAHPTGDIAYATDLSNRLYPGQADLTRELRPALAGAVASLGREGVDVVNLSDILRDKTVDVFVETSHFNGTGNGMIAEAIARAILHGPGS